VTGCVTPYRHSYFYTLFFLPSFLFFFFSSSLNILLFFKQYKLLACLVTALFLVTRNTIQFDSFTRYTTQQLPLFDRISE